jgi:hypothetical protein
LPLWASRCASADGSADDTTIALLIAPSAMGSHRAAAREPGAGQLSTATARRPAEPEVMPGRLMGVTRERWPATRSRRPATRSGWPATRSGWPATRSRRLMVIAASAVVIAALAAVLAIRLSSSSGPAPTSCGSPSAGVQAHPTVSATPAVAPQAGATGHPCEGG